MLTTNGRTKAKQKLGMKKVLKKRNHKLVNVYTWAVVYSTGKAKARKALRKSNDKE